MAREKKRKQSPVVVEIFGTLADATIRGLSTMRGIHLDTDEFDKAISAATYCPEVVLLPVTIDHKDLVDELLRQTGVDAVYVKRIARERT